MMRTSMMFHTKLASLTLHDRELQVRVAPRPSLLALEATSRRLLIDEQRTRTRNSGTDAARWSRV